jgi:hypothetical protein
MTQNGDWSHHGVVVTRLPKLTGLDFRINGDTAAFVTTCCACAWYIISLETIDLMVEQKTERRGESANKSHIVRVLVEGLHIGCKAEANSLV